MFDEIISELKPQKIAICWKYLQTKYNLEEHSKWSEQLYTIVCTCKVVKNASAVPKKLKFVANAEKY